MLVFIQTLFLLVISSLSFGAPISKTIICAKAGQAPKAVLFLATKSLDGAVASLGGPDMIVADSCLLGIAKEFKNDISEPKNVIGACVSITSDGGDGELSILRSVTKDSYKLEVKPIIVDEPSLARGEFFDCY